jgi:transcriptional regulator with XRE-family HTH domain
MELKKLVIDCIALAGSQTKLAIALSTSRQNVSNWLSGRCKPNVTMYLKLKEYAYGK